MNVMMNLPFRRIVARLACGLVLAAMAVDSQAAIITNNTTSGYFTNAAIWVGGVVPGSGDDARITTLNNLTVVIDGGDRTVQQLSSSRATSTFVLNMDPGATLLTKLNIGGTVIVSNGTLQIAVAGPVFGGGNSLLTGGALPASLILSGGNYSQTNATALNFEAGTAADSVVRVDAGSTFSFKGKTHGAALGSEVGSPTGRKKVLFQVNGGTADLTTADGYESIVVGKWDSADSVAKMTSIVSVASGSLNVVTNVTTPGGPGQRLVVGGRTAAVLGNPETDFDQHVAQVVVSNTGTLNVGGGGVEVGRNAGGSGGELAILGGAANLNGLVLGDLGKLTQTNGVLKFTAKSQFMNEATNNTQHLFMTGGLTLFQGISASSMTINMGGANAGNVLGQGFYNVQFGSNGGSAFTINLTNNAFYGRGDATGGNHVFGDGIMDLVIWTNTSVIYNSTTYSGTSGPNSLLDFATLATPWGWDISVGAIPEPTVVGLIGLGSLLAVVFRRRKA